MTGLHIPEKTCESIFAGRFQREGYTVEKVIINCQDCIPIPCLVFVPDGGEKHPAVLYLAYLGKEMDAQEGGLIESIVRSGSIVLAPDLPGCGELTVEVHRDDSVIRGVSYNLVFGAQLIGRSVTGIQAESILRAYRYLAARGDVIENDIGAIARGSSGPALMHAAAFESGLKRVALLESPMSWESVLLHQYYNQVIGSTIVPSALKYYDLPDLLGLMAPRSLLVVDPVDGDGEPAPEQIRRKLAGILTPHYRHVPEQMTITVTSPETSLPDILSRWLGSN